MENLSNFVFGHNIYDRVPSRNKRFVGQLLSVVSAVSGLPFIKELLSFGGKAFSAFDLHHSLSSLSLAHCSLLAVSLRSLTSSLIALFSSFSQLSLSSNHWMLKNFVLLGNYLNSRSIKSRIQAAEESLNIRIDAAEEDFSEKLRHFSEDQYSINMKVEPI